MKWGKWYTLFMVLLMVSTSFVTPAYAKGGILDDFLLALKIIFSPSITAYAGLGETCAEDTDCDLGRSITLFCDKETKVCVEEHVIGGMTLPVTAEEKRQYDYASDKYDIQKAIKGMEVAVDFALERGAEVDELNSIKNNMLRVSDNLDYAFAEENATRYDVSIEEIKLLREKFKEEARTIGVIKENREEILNQIEEKLADKTFSERVETERMIGSAPVMEKLFDKRIQKEEEYIQMMEDKGLDVTDIKAKFDDLKNQKDEFLTYTGTEGDYSKFSDIQQEFNDLHKDIKTSAGNIVKNEVLSESVESTMKIVQDITRIINAQAADVNFTKEKINLQEINDTLTEALKAKATGNFELAQEIMDDVKEKYDTFKDAGEVKIRAEVEKDEFTQRIDTLNNKYFERKAAYDAIKEKFTEEVPPEIPIMDKVIGEYRDNLDEAKTFLAGKKYDKALAMINRLEAQRDMVVDVVENKLPMIAGETPKVVENLEKEFGTITSDKIADLMDKEPEKAADAMIYSREIAEDFAKTHPDELNEFIATHEDFGRELKEVQTPVFYELSKTNPEIIEEMKDVFYVKDSDEFVKDIADDAEVFKEIYDENKTRAKEIVEEKPTSFIEFGEEFKEEAKAFLEENKDDMKEVINKSDAFLPFLRKNEDFAKDVFEIDIQLEDPEYVARLIKDNPEKAVEIITQNAKTARRLLEHKGDEIESFMGEYKDDMRTFFEGYAKEAEFEKFFKNRPGLAQDFGRKFSSELDAETMRHLMLFNPDEARRLAKENAGVFKQMMTGGFKNDFEEFAMYNEEYLKEIIQENPDEFVGSFGERFKMYETKFMPEILRKKECKMDTDCKDLVCPMVECMNTPVCLSGKCECGPSPNEFKKCQEFKEERVMQGRCRVKEDCPAPPGTVAMCENGFCKAKMTQDMLLKCGDGVCESGVEGAFVCPKDCGKPVCNKNGVCDMLNEDPWMCPEDCKKEFEAMGVCGDGICDSWEDKFVCNSDCRNADSSNWECFGPNDCDTIYGRGYCGPGKGPMCDKEHRCGCMDSANFGGSFCGNKVCEKEEGAGGTSPCFGDCGCDVYKGYNCLKETDLKNWRCDPSSCKDKCSGYTYCNEFGECICGAEIKKCTSDSDCTCYDGIPRCNAGMGYCFCEFTAIAKPVMFGNAYCGDKICDAFESSNPGMCPADCGGCDCGRLACSTGQFCDTFNCRCETSKCDCASLRCESTGKWCDPMTCVCVSGGYCGDRKCDPGESGWCTEDCGGMGYCGDGKCDSGEGMSCPKDCSTMSTVGTFCDCRALNCRMEEYCEPKECACKKTSMCGDGRCDPGEGSWCAADCGQTTGGCRSDAECAAFPCPYNEKPRCDFGRYSCYCMRTEAIGIMPYCGDAQVPPAGCICSGVNLYSGYCCNGVQKWEPCGGTTGVCNNDWECPPGYYCGASRTCMPTGGMVSQTCSEKGGIKCAPGDACNGRWESASDTANCCIGGTCQVGGGMVSGCGSYSNDKTTCTNKGCTWCEGITSSMAMGCYPYGQFCGTSQQPTGYCGDGACNGYETATSCPSDCQVGGTMGCPYGYISSQCSCSGVTCNAGQYCCYGTCQSVACGTSSGTCSSLGGTCCGAATDIVCSGWIQGQATDCPAKCCMSGTCQSATQTCSSVGGTCCSSGQSCSGGWFDSAPYSGCSSGMCCRGGTCSSSGMQCTIWNSVGNSCNPTTGICCVSPNMCSNTAGPGTCQSGSGVTVCSQGQITSTCTCGGTQYSSGYCCNGVYQSTGPCSGITNCALNSNIPSSGCICGGATYYSGWCCSNNAQASSSSGCGGGLCSQYQLDTGYIECSGACVDRFAEGNCGGCGTSCSGYGGCCASSKWNSGTKTFSCSGTSCCCSPPTTCSSTNYAACTSSNCASVGRYWCTTTSTCVSSSSSCTTGCSSTNYAACTSSTCAGAGGYWCTTTNSCVSSSSSCGTTQTCSQGSIPSSGCTCGGVTYTSGYCCNGVYQSTACAVSCTSDANCGANEYCGASQTCMPISSCPTGAITMKCMCGGTAYNSGYCCSSVYQSTGCTASQTCSQLGGACGCSGTCSTWLTTASDCPSSCCMSGACQTVSPCSEGQITSTCTCGGLQWSSGYCCGGIHQDNSCASMQCTIWHTLGQDCNPPSGICCSGSMCSNTQGAGTCQ